MSKFEYLKLADTVAAEIASGELKPGDRLPPQRSFAYERKIAVSTASRVYTELLRRGLVVGEVGRGTFVSGNARRPVTTLTEPRDARIDLEVNYPMLPTQSALIARSLAGLEQPEALEAALRQGTSSGTQTARNISADFLSGNGWSARPEQIVFTANGRQSIAATLAAIVPPGGRCGVEALSYPFIKGIAARLGVTLVPLAMDEHGVRPDAVEKASHEAHLAALYNEAPLAALAPNSCVLVDSLSKKVAPGLALGFIIPPPRLRESVMASVRSGGWTPSGYSFAAAQRMMADGTAAELVRLKRIDAQRRQQIAAERLAGFEIQANPNSYHLWLTLPPQWRSQTFVTAAARRDIALTPSSTFAVSPGHAPNAVRLALAAPRIDQLEAALRTLAEILSSSEEDYESTE